MGGAGLGGFRWKFREVTGVLAEERGEKGVGLRVWIVLGGTFVVLARHSERKVDFGVRSWLCGGGGGCLAALNAPG